ncbi:MAG: 50S ribosomal protein L3 N(5)-glutamine methyltransferase [Hyphomicrobium sp.]|nr:50S ribosomal protein L3 N(5)-glutamine methyltransferase [Hyphomicrobium sp.]
MPPAVQTDDLLTVRDWLRFGVTSFNQAGLSYGHGTATAFDEAAFLLLSALALPIDTLEPWLDCRLTGAERHAIADLFAQRVATRKPASYLVNAAYIQGRRFYVDERVIIPRSIIGELLCIDALAAAIDVPDEISSVLDLCTGSGCLAILAAEAFPAARIDAADLSVEALAVAKRNVADYALDDRITLIPSDVFSALGGRSYDLIISNPPYVTRAAVAAFPPEYRAEPVMAHVSGDDGLDHVRQILAKAAEHLSDSGTLVVEIGQGRDALEEAFPTLPFLWLDTETSQGEVFTLQRAELLNS